VKTIVLFCASLLPWWLNAQVPFEVCQDRQGNPIAGIVDNTTPYAGIATEQNGRPVIVWNQRSNAVLSRTEQIFIYLHECAHLTLGHLYRQPYTPAVELEADCWAIQLMVDGGMIKARHLDCWRSPGEPFGETPITWEEKRISRVSSGVSMFAPIRRRGPRLWTRLPARHRTASPCNGAGS
jgi:hypothetical protein